MKVCLVNALFHPFSGGVEKHMLELSRELVKQDVDVTIVTARIEGTPAYEEMDGVKVHRVPCLSVKVPGLYPPPFVMSPFFALYLKRLDDENGFDIIHLQNRFFVDFDTAALYARLKKKPFMMTIHNARPLGISLPISVFGSAYDWAIGRWPFAMADRIIAVSEWVKYDIARYRIDERKIVPVHNGINVGSFRPTAATNVRKQYGIDGPMLLFVGRMITQKGVPYLIDAMPLVLEKHPDTKLLLVGRGNALESLKKKVGAMGLEKSVIFSGYMTEDMLKETYGTCDMFVLPSVWEVLPIAILEAMSSSKPVVCTNAGGNAELVKDGYNGYVVPMRSPEALADRINDLLDDPEKMKSMGCAGRRRAEDEFDWKLIASKTKHVYEDLLMEKKNGGRKNNRYYPHVNVT
ncbi:putative glycosyltransferase [Methanocella paludicola SANAE]|uniref:Glycosyltransferase n=1 Tax=Methanocella paludicola (strain DSM 17711 / JCM 13418 / NBRC 101707 / SANAE) TaxID=304371 RepID=D1YUU4_METPS|nr:glycosyltransferase family 4 protein [Methanocella paludicola]BAI60216.1 putative glycosyltransferase [Methanocella paludicola SANAE]